MVLCGAALERVDLVQQQHIRRGDLTASLHISDVPREVLRIDKGHNPIEPEWTARRGTRPRNWSDDHAVMRFRSYAAAHLSNSASSQNCSATGPGSAMPVVSTRT